MKRIAPIFLLSLATLILAGCDSPKEPEKVPYKRLELEPLKPGQAPSPMPPASNTKSTGARAALTPLAAEQLRAKGARLPSGDSGSK